MKFDLIYQLKKIRITTARVLIVFFLAVVSSLFVQCKDDSLNFINKEDSSIKLRDGGGEDPSTNDLLELVGIACVPGSIDIGTGCNDVTYTDTATITLTGFSSGPPGCTVTVVYNYYLCTAGSLIDYTMGDFQILSHNCPGFTSAFASAIAAGGSTLTNFVESFELTVYNQIQAQVIAQYVPINSQYVCLQGVFFDIFFLKASCYKKCFYSLGNGAQTYAKIACGVDCCERHTRVCRNASNVLVIDTYYIHPSDPYCTDPPDFSGNPVLTRCDSETSCVYKCLEE